MSQIIVCHEKHDRRYWDASTDEAFARSALAILTERWKDGYWYHDPDKLGTGGWAENEREQQAKALAMTQEQLAALPEDARTSVLAQRQQAKRDNAYKQQYRDWWHRAKRVVEEQDTGTVNIGRGRFARELPEAWVLLDERSDAEYERVELVKLLASPPG